MSRGCSLGHSWKQLASRDAILFFLKPTWQLLESEGRRVCVPRLLVGACMAVIGDHWGPVGHLAKEMFGLHRCLWAATNGQGGAESSIQRGPHRNWRSQEEIRKIWSPSTENYMFLDAQESSKLIKIIKNRLKFQSESCLHQNSIQINWPTGPGSPEPSLG